MALALLLISGLLALTAVCVVATQADETVNPLAVDPAHLEVADPAADTHAGLHGATPAPTGDWQLHTVTSLRDAEAFLDCLERQGIAEKELVILGKAHFAIRWR